MRLCTFVTSLVCKIKQGYVKPFVIGVLSIRPLFDFNSILVEGNCGDHVMNFPGNCSDICRLMCLCYV